MANVVDFIVVTVFLLLLDQNVLETINVKGGRKGNQGQILFSKAVSDMRLPKVT